jgi:hypothetical protein
MSQALPRRRRNHALWLGPLVTLAGALSYFVFFARFPALRDVPWINLAAVAGGVGWSSVALWRAWARPECCRGRRLGVASVAGSVLLAAGFGAYVFVLSYGLPAPTPRALDLVQAPEFSLGDQDGREITLAGLRDRKIVLVFYRGYW